MAAFLHLALKQIRNKEMKKPRRVIAAASMLAMLYACGGGGGEETGATPSDPAPADSSINSQVPSSSYAAGSEELAAFNLLNAERIRCGFGALQQNAQLDQAALAHADWMLINNIYAHEEDPAHPNGFTGVYHFDRATFAGYPWTDAGEGIAFDDSGSIVGQGTKGVRGLFSAAYHAISLLKPMKDIGISVRAPADVGVSTVIVPTEIMTGTTDGYQLLDKSGVVTYPCNGTTGTAYELTGEDPNPVPGRNLSTSPLGHAVTIMVRHGQTLTLSSAQMLRSSDGASVPLRAPVTGDADPNGKLSNLPYVGYVLPDVPLQPNTEYTVTINGTNNGTPFQRTFVFTTGS